MPETKSEAQFLVSVGGPYEAELFTELSGGESRRETSDYPVPGAFRMDTVLGIEKITNITLRVPYTPERHTKLYAIFKKYCGEAIDVQSQPVKLCPEIEPDGDPTTFIGCKPIRYKQPDVNQGGNTPGVIEMEFTVREKKVG